MGERDPRLVDLLQRAANAPTGAEAAQLTRQAKNLAIEIQSQSPSLREKAGLPPLAPVSSGEKENERK
jgi:hypothetical protein